MAEKIFFCYAHEDELLLSKLKTHLKPLQRQGLIDVWYDRDISAGTRWEEEINKHLNEANIILLLVSPDFMDSDYCYGIEMQRALERDKRREARVIPIILRPVHWHGVLGELQALPKDGLAITDPTWYNLDRAFYNVVEGILEAVKSLLKQKEEEKQSQLAYDTQLPHSFQEPSEQEINEAFKSVQTRPNLTSKPWEQKGDEFRSQGLYLEALASYEEAIRLNPNPAVLYKYKGDILNEAERYDEALAAYDKAISLHPNFGAAFYCKALILDLLAKPEAAQEAYKQASKANHKLICTKCANGIQPTDKYCDACGSLLLE